jgi:hypothetical protein
MRVKFTAAAVLLPFLCAPVWAINKCTAPDGKVSFQDAPCNVGTGGHIDVRPASGSAPPPAGDSIAPGAGTPHRTEAQRLEGVLAKSQAYRRRVELESLLVPNAQAALNQTRARCDAELQTLHARKSRANNNLAGATWEASLSQEMQAVSLRCDTQQRELKDDFEALRKECTGLDGCKQW